MARKKKKKKKKQRGKGKSKGSSGGGGGGGSLLSLRGGVQNAAKGKSQWFNWLLWIAVAIVLGLLVRKYIL